MSDQRTDTLLAFLLGATVGAGVALLLAPASGDETRRRLSEQARRLGDDVEHKLHGVKDEIKSHSGDLTKALTAGKDAFDRARHGTEPAPTSTAM
jgi:gas vesicle protein